jgi:integrase
MEKESERQTRRVHLTLDRIRKFSCPDDTAQAFLWDDNPKRLAVRATRGSDKKAFIFSGTINGRLARITIGSTDAWNLDAARAEAGRLQTLIDQGIDPREQRRQDDAKREQDRKDFERADALVSEAWDAYIAARTPKWGARNLADHQSMTKPGGEPWTRGRRGGATVTEPGELAPLLALKLFDLTAARVGDWLAKEVARRPARAALAFRLLRAFVRWCAEREDYAGVVHADACAKRDVREQVPAVRAKQDALLRDQLSAWFKEVRAILNPVISAYLQALLLTGARREELAGLQWSDIDFRWKRLTIRDKAETATYGEGEGFRVIPLTPYVAALLNGLPRRTREINGKQVPIPWVFSSPTAESGRLQDPRDAHARACKAAGIEGLTLHGLRRSFGSLAEWVEIPAGVVAQIQGHKPSATAEKHYRVRPVDLLATWHDKFEAWILERAGVEFDAAAAEGLRLVSSNSAT